MLCTIRNITISKQRGDGMQIKNNKNILLVLMSVFIVSVPIAANAAPGLLSTDSTGRFEYDSDKNGIPDVIIDTGDVDNLNQSQNTNSSEISALQTKYDDLMTALASDEAQIKDIAAGKEFTVTLVNNPKFVGAEQTNPLLSNTMTAAGTYFFPNVKEFKATALSGSWTYSVNNGTDTTVTSGQTIVCNGNLMLKSTMKNTSICPSIATSSTSGTFIITTK